MIRYYKLHPILIGGMLRDEFMLDQNLKRDLENWIYSPIQFRNTNGEISTYADVNENLENRIPVLRKLSDETVINLNQLLGYYILAEYDKNKLVHYLNNYINNRPLEHTYTVEDFPYDFLDILFKKASNPFESNGLELTSDMIVHGQVPEQSMWKKITALYPPNHEPPAAAVARPQYTIKGGFKFIAQVFISNGDTEELSNFINMPFPPNPPGEDDLGLIDAFNHFMTDRAYKIIKFNDIFSFLHHQGVISELVELPGEETMTMTDDEAIFRRISFGANRVRDSWDTGIQRSAAENELYRQYHGLARDGTHLPRHLRPPHLRPPHPDDSDYDSDSEEARAAHDNRTNLQERVRQFFNPLPSNADPPREDNSYTALRPSSGSSSTESLADTLSLTSDDSEQEIMVAVELGTPLGAVEGEAQWEQWASMLD